MPAEPFPWTDRLLAIPYAIAARYARPDTQRYDELVSAGNEGLARGAANYDPSKGASPATWLFRWAKEMVRRAADAGDKYRHESRWRSMRSLDEPLGGGPDGGKTLADLVAAAEPQPGDVVEADDALSRALSRLGAEDRAVFVLRYGRGMTFGEIAGRLGRSPPWVSKRAELSLRKLRRFAARIGSRPRGGNPAPEPPRGQAQRDGTRRHHALRVRLARAAGDVPSRRARAGDFYLADDRARTLEGPGRAKNLLARLGVPFPAKGGRPASVAGDERLGGRRLVRLAEGAALAREGYRLVELPAAGDEEGAA